MKRKLYFLGLILAAIFMFFPTSVKAQDLYFPKKIGLLTGEDTSFWVSPIAQNISYNDIKISGLKNSNKKVAKVSKLGKYGVSIQTKKVGKTKISFTAKYGKKTKNISATIYVRDYENPVQSFKVNGVQLKTKFQHTYNENIHMNEKCTVKVKNSKKVKLQIKARSGWKVSTIGIRYADGTGGYAPLLEYSNKYNKSFNEKQKIELLRIQFYNTKTAVHESVEVYLK